MGVNMEVGHLNLLRLKLCDTWVKVREREREREHLCKITLLQIKGK